jgi:nitrate reductase gamma subunit
LNQSLRERIRSDSFAMDLLDFARGPALTVALAVFVLGTLWRLARVLARPRMPDLSPAREGAPSLLVGALRAILRGMWPRGDFGANALFTTINGYVFHIGLALIVFGYAPHIAFIRRVTGLAWPALPDTVMYVAAGATIISLLLALGARLTDAVLKQISNADDWISWTITFLPVMTGMALLSESSATSLARDAVLYRAPLAVHLLTLELLLVWFPFGKLMHAFLFAFSRGATGMRFSHRGVRL